MTLTYAMEAVQACLLDTACTTWPDNQKNALSEQWASLHGLQTMLQALLHACAECTRCTYSFPNGCMDLLIAD